MTVTTAIRSPSVGALPLLQTGTGFLWVMLAVTAIPFVLMPVSAGFVHPGWGLRAGDATILFLASGTHVAGSYAFYLDPEMRATIRSRPGRFVVAPLLLVGGSAVVFSLVSPKTAASLLVLYFIWQTHHYTRQNIGILSFSAKASGTAAPSQMERAAVTTAGWAGVIGMITLATPYVDTPLRHLVWQIHTLGRLTLLGALIVGALALPSVLRTGNTFRVIFFLVCLLFYLPLFLPFAVFRNPLAAVSSYAFAHGLQYLVMMGYVGRGGRAGPSRWTMPALVAAVALLGGWLLAAMQVGTHWGGAAKFIFGAYLGLVMVHFVIDAGIWKLSDPVNRAYMAKRFAFLQ